MRTIIALVAFLLCPPASAQVGTIEPPRGRAGRDPHRPVVTKLHDRDKDVTIGLYLSRPILGGEWGAKPDGNFAVAVMNPGFRKGSMYTPMENADVGAYLGRLIESDAYDTFPFMHHAPECADPVRTFDSDPDLPILMADLTVMAGPLDLGGAPMWLYAYFELTPIKCLDDQRDGYTITIPTESGDAYWAGVLTAVSLELDPSRRFSYGEFGRPETREDFDPDALDGSMRVLRDGLKSRFESWGTMTGPLNGTCLRADEYATPGMRNWQIDLSVVEPEPRVDPNRYWSFTREVGNNKLLPGFVLAHFEVRPTSEDAWVLYRRARAVPKALSDSWDAHTNAAASDKHQRLTPGKQDVDDVTNDL